MGQQRAAVREQITSQSEPDNTPEGFTDSQDVDDDDFVADRFFRSRPELVARSGMK
jgi:hypothetical protein